MNSVRVQDPSDMRVALERFSYGFPVVTVQGDTQEFVGTLANSFHSLPDSPNLVVCSMGQLIREMPAYRQSNYFAVNLLSTEQQSLASHFSHYPVERFDGVDCELGVGHSPMLRGCAVRIECKTQYCYEVGEEFIYIGEVLYCDSSGLEDLQLSHDKK